MDDDQDSLTAVLQQPAALVATALATLFLAGSASLICRSGRRRPVPTIPPDDSKQHGTPVPNHTRDAKVAARSKERRRRGKDPLKELLKGGKNQLKILSPRDVGSGSGNSASQASSALPSPLPPQPSAAPPSQPSQRSASLSTSSRSVSSSTSATSTSTPTDAGDATPSAGTGIDKSGNRTISAPVPNISVPPNSLTSSSSSPSLTSLDTSRSTDRQHPHQRQRSPLYTSASSPWDWDGLGASRPPPPPRFRSQSSSRAVPATALSSEAAADGPVFSLNAHAASRPPPGPARDGGTPPARCTPTPGSASGSASASGSGSNSNAGSGRGTPPPQTQLASLRGALEAARMREEKARAELERAARDNEVLQWENGTWRRREIELQAHIHHLMHQLQAYSALFVSSAMPPQPQPQPNLQVPGGGGSQGTSPSSSESPNSFAPSSALPFGPPSPNMYAPPPPGMGMFPPPMLSPGVQPPSPFFAYPQPPLHAYPHQHQHQHPPHPQQASLFSVLFPGAPHESGRSGSSGSGPPSSVSSSSGADSPDLPPLAMAVDRGRRRARTQMTETRIGPGVDSAGWEEGWVGVEAQDGDGNDEEARKHEVSGAVGSSDGDEQEEEDGGFSEVLADAILKRPESIRVRTRRSKEKDNDKQPQQQSETTAEFTFPSLLDFGMSNRGGHKERHADVDADVDAGTVGETVPESGRVECTADPERGDAAPEPSGSREQ